MGFYFFLLTIHKGVKNIYYFNDERETKGREERKRWERRERTELFILFVGIVYIILMSCM